MYIQIIPMPPKPNRICDPPMDMDVNDSKFSIAGFIDPEGNYIGLYKPGQG